MTTNRFSNGQRVVLLCVLAFCVVAMHHVSSTSGMSDTAAATTHAMPVAGMEAVAAPQVAASGEHGPGMPSEMHDILHLCLAVLAAAGALLAAVVAFLAMSHRKALLFQVTKLRGSPRRGRPPDRSGRSILTSLCVLRT
ncbi:DUF6153 family protein [Amycolatopsis sp. NPDC051061]|uniref:DUF6153 family protein n=1 Tax=Amycolatopsis sp. NPDC051061 TaxID=3155042 RepID=UPI00343871E7